MTSLQALYSEPVARLLAVGEPDISPAWPDYGELGLRHEHAPELLRMLYDPALNMANAESTEVWAPLHAMRALAQMKAPEAIEGLLPALDEFDDDDSFWLDIPEAYALLGPAAIPALRTYLADPTHGMYARVCAAECLEEISSSAPEARTECVAAVRNQLRQAPAQELTFNGLLVSTLMDMEALEALDEIRDAFNAGTVNINIAGDLEDVEIALGVRTKRDTPQPRYNQFDPDLTPDMDALQALMMEEIFEEDEDIDAVQEPYVRPDAKVGRNDPCPCGSGKKYKKCCG